MEITQYKPMHKNSLQGFFTLKIPKWGNFIIKDIGYFKKDNQRWISFPSKQYEKDNEKKYFSYCQFEEASTMKDFQTKVLEALDDFMNKNQLQFSNNDQIPF